jgi:hypothetical protein
MGAGDAGGGRVPLAGGRGAGAGAIGNVRVVCAAPVPGGGSSVGVDLGVVAGASTAARGGVGFGALPRRPCQ